MTDQLPSHVYSAADAAIGHNQPPLIERLAMDYDGKIAAANTLAERAKGLQTIALGDSAALDLAANVIRDARTQDKMLTADKAKEKEPFDTAAKAVLDFFRGPLATIQTAKTTAQRLLDDHTARQDADARRLLKEAAEREREEADRRAEVARKMEANGVQAGAEQVMDFALNSETGASQMEQAATHGSTADMTRTYTDSGTVSGKTEWTFTITDPEALRATMGKLGDYLTIAAIEQAVRGYKTAATKAQRRPELPGVDFSKVSKALVR
jgi:hypothetical protein